MTQMPCMSEWPGFWKCSACLEHQALFRSLTLKIKYYKLQLGLENVSSFL